MSRNNVYLCLDTARRAVTRGEAPSQSPCCADPHQLSRPGLGIDKPISSSRPHRLAIVPAARNLDPGTASTTTESGASRRPRSGAPGEACTALPTSFWALSPRLHADLPLVSAAHGGGSLASPSAHCEGGNVSEVLPVVRFGGADRASTMGRGQQGLSPSPAWRGRVSGPNGSFKRGLKTKGDRKPPIQ